MSKQFAVVQELRPFYRLPGGKRVVVRTFRYRWLACIYRWYLESCCEPAARLNYSWSVIEI